MSDPIRFTLDGAEVEAQPGETIWQVANRLGTEIPHLCWLPKPGYRADGNCRACMVEIDGERVLAASCIRKPSPGMKVQTASERARVSRKLVFELLVADQPERATAHPPPAARPQPPGDGRPSRCLHRLHAVRPRLPRGAGQ